MLLDVAQFLVDTWGKIWNFLLNGGYMGLAVILIPVLRKLTRVMREFTN